jgi:hypothetical protein
MTDSEALRLAAAMTRHLDKIFEYYMRIQEQHPRGAEISEALGDEGIGLCVTCEDTVRDVLNTKQGGSL